MTVKDLRTLVDNLDEYIHVPGGIERLKKTILHLAVSGQIVPQDPSEGTGQKLYDQIQLEKSKKQKYLPAVTESDSPFQIPDSWKWVRLGDVSRSISYGYTESSSKEEIGPKFVRITDIQNSRINWDKVPFCKIEEKNKPKYLLEDGDILFARTGGTVGKSYLCKNPPESVFASYLIRVQPSKGFISNYLLYYFETPFYWSSIYSDMSGTGQPNFNGTKLNNLLIPIPPNAEQRRIVKKIETIFIFIDELAEKYNAEQEERKKLVVSSLAKLSKGESILGLGLLTGIIKTKTDVAELRKTILYLAVSGQLVPQDSSEGTGKELYDQIQTEKQKFIAEGKLKKQKSLSEITKEETRFKIPGSWKWVRLGEVCWLDQGARTTGKEYNNLDAKYLRGKKDPEEKHSGFLIQKGERAILVDGENSGEVFVVPETGYLGSTFKALSVVDGIDGGYLNFLLTNLKEEMRQNKIGAAIPHLDKKLFREKLIPLPSLAEQTRIVHKTTQLLGLVTKLEQNLEK